MFYSTLAPLQSNILTTASENPLLNKLFWSIVGIIVVYALIALSVRIFTRLIKGHERLHKTRKWLYYIGAAAVLVTMIGIWSESLGEIALTVGVLGAGLALALQSPVVNMAGWLFVVIQRPYDMGDRIEINNIAGDVIDIRLFKTVVLEIYADGAGKGSQSTGRVADFPNSLVFSNTLYNYTRGFDYLWNEYPIVLTFESDWQKATQILEKIVNEHTLKYESGARSEIEKMSKSYLIQYGALTPIVLMAIRDSGIELGLRYITPARGRRVIRDAISQDILIAFDAEPKIELAYPTYRIFRREIEEPALTIPE